MGLIQYYQITCQPVNQAIRIFIIITIVFCNLVSIKCIIVLLFAYIISEYKKNHSNCQCISRPPLLSANFSPSYLTFKCIKVNLKLCDPPPKGSRPKVWESPILPIWATSQCDTLCQGIGNQINDLPACEHKMQWHASGSIKTCNAMILHIKWKIKISECLHISNRF